MSLFVAKLEGNNLNHDPASHSDATVIHIDDSRNIVWLWIPQLHTAQIESNNEDLYVWNDLDGEVVQFSQVDPSFHYKGIVRLVVERQTLSKQGSSLTIPNIEPVTWTDTEESLQQVVDAINPTDASERTLSILKAIAIQASSQHDELQSNPPLQVWLASNTPTKRADLANSLVFANAMRHRPHLFAELAQQVPEQRMALLIGSEQSYLDEMLDGFQDHIEMRCSEELTHVTARFDSDHFALIYNSFKDPLTYPELDSLFAAIAFAAVNGLKLKAGTFLPKIFTIEMFDNPVKFAKAYFETATQYERDHWQCISHFLEFLTRAAKVAGVTGKITIFLPFDKVDEIINENKSARHHLWEGLRALQQRLEKHPQDCPQLGIILAVKDLAIDRMTEHQFLRRVLTTPPLSRTEVGNLLQLFWGASADNEELNKIDDFCGGDPWFLFLLLRCLKAVTQKRAEANMLVRGEDAITEACNLALLAICADDTNPQRLSVPPDVRGNVDLYLDQCKSILQLHTGAQGARIVLNAWEHPEGYQGIRREIKEFERAWIRTGLVYPQVFGATRGESLASLREYPLYQFCKAGKLPFAFAERLVAQVGGRNQL